VDQGAALIVRVSSSESIVAEELLRAQRKLVKTSMAFYLLRGRSERVLALEPPELGYFNDHFASVSMRDDWKAPPFDVVGESYPLRDCVRWFLGAPVFSEQAHDALKDTLRDCVEFLLLGEVKSESGAAARSSRLRKRETWCLSHQASSIS
jgi:hypothetical protein